MPATINRVLEAEVAQPYRAMAFIFVVVLAASLFGILTRPIGVLAAVWPANAILMAMMVRNPALARPGCWVAAFLAYLAADFMTGGGFLVTLWLTVANMVGVAVGYALFMQLDDDDRRLQRPLSIVSMFGICAIAAAAAGVAGSGVTRIVFARDILTGFAAWFTSDLVNAIIMLPIILTAPAPRKLFHTLRHFHSREHDWRPVMVLVLATVGGIMIGGPGALAYPMPALLWCALSYNFFTTAVVTMCFCVVMLIATSAGIIPAYADGDEMLITVSIRLAVALVALGPLAVASINAARDELLQRLQHIANHDTLTGILSRSAFLDLGARKLITNGGRKTPVLALMIDIDHFKSVNDRFGHATGDLVLTETTIALSAALREGDLFGRLGGEEFAVICSLNSEEGLTIIPERLRKAVENLVLTGPDGEPLRVTISIGAAVARTPTRSRLDTLLAAADAALYKAKAGGRNKVVVAEIATPEDIFAEDVIPNGAPVMP